MASVCRKTGMRLEILAVLLEKPCEEPVLGLIENFGRARPSERTPRGRVALGVRRPSHACVSISFFVGFPWFSISFRLVFDGFDRVPLRFSMSP